MPVVLVVPGLLAHARDALERSSLPAIVRSARTSHVEGEGIDAAVGIVSGLARGIGAAPLAALGAGCDLANRAIAYADPIVLRVGHVDVTLAARVDDVADADAAAIIADLNRHFANDGLAFVVPRPDRWLVHAGELPPLDAAPLERARGQNLREALPRGPGGERWLKWLNEVQMLLHEHPVNRAREAQGLPPVNGIWFSGTGRLSAASRPAIARVTATPGRDGDVARGLARLAGIQPGTLPRRWIDFDGTSPGATLIALPDQRAGDLGAIDSHWLRPAMGALEDRSLDELIVVSDGHGAAVTWRCSRQGALRRTIARFKSLAFEVPAGPEV